MKTILKYISHFLNYNIEFSDSISISIKHILVLIVTLIVAKKAIQKLENIITKRIKDDDDVNKFHTVFAFGKWFIYIVIFLVTLSSVGVKLNALFASAAALMIGIGLALQTWFQDIMTGIFIILDKSLQVGDIIEFEDKIGRVVEIRLRTTRVITKEYKTIIIPNHVYLTKNLCNWTKNGTQTKVNIAIGVAYGSDVELVKKLLIQAVNQHESVIKMIPAIVLFEDFGESALQFRIVFTIKNKVMPSMVLSDIRFTIDKLFREHNISIPFPQRDLHIINKKNYE